MAYINVNTQRGGLAKTKRLQCIEVVMYEPSFVWTCIISVIIMDLLEKEKNRIITFDLLYMFVLHS